MTLHVKQTQTVTYGTISYPAKMYVEPDEVWVKNNGSYCSAKEVWVKNGGTYCKVWPTPKDVHVWMVNSKTFSGFHFMGAPHAYAGSAETYTVKVDYGGYPYGTGFVGTTPITDPGAGTVIIEAQKKGSTTWTEVGRTMISGTEPNGLVTVNGVWPSSMGDYNFRARFVTADADHYNSATGPVRVSVGTATKPSGPMYITVENRPPGTPAGATPTTTGSFSVRIDKIVDSKGQNAATQFNIIGSRITITATANEYKGFSRTGAPGNFQVQWKLTTEGGNKWTNVGGAHHSTNGTLSTSVTMSNGYAGTPEFRVIFTPDKGGSAVTSASAKAGTVVPGAPGGVRVTSRGSTSVAFSWNRVADANGYGIYGPAAGNFKRTTGTSSGSMGLGTNQFGVFYVKAYATDRTGHRWYGLPSPAYDYSGGTKNWVTHRYGYDYYHSQPKNP